MKHPFFLLTLSLLLHSPCFSQTTLLTGLMGINYYQNEPATGDSSTFAYNSMLQLNERMFWTLDTSGIWDLKTRFTGHSYDPDGNILYYLNQASDGNNNWVNYQQNTYTYDNNGKQLSNLVESWNAANGWINSKRETATYDLNGRQLSRLIEKWLVSTWVVQSVKLWAYDASGNLTSEENGNYRTLYSYNAENLLETKTQQELNGSWENKAQTRYTYLPNNTQIASETFYYFLNNGWQESSRNSNVYDIHGNLIFHLAEQSINANWVNFSQDFHLYDSSGYPIQDSTQYWVINGWENSSKSVYQYDAAHNQVFSSWQIWEAGLWKNATRTFNGYDAEFNWINFRNERWTGTAWELSTYVRNHYSKINGTVNPDQAPLEVFPNPASSTVTIKGEGLKLAFIIDQQGRTLRTQSLEGPEEATMQLGNLPTGNYFLQVWGRDGKARVKPLQIRR